MQDWKSTARNTFKQLRSFNVTISDLSEYSRQRGLNHGKGYSYHYLRQCLTICDTYKEEILELALDVLEAEIEKREQKKAALSQRYISLKKRYKAIENMAV